MLTLESLLLLAFILLPGAHARITALRSLPQPWSESYRSQTQELIEILFYSLVTSLIAGLGLTAVAVAFFEVEPAIRDLLAHSLGAISEEQRVDAVIWLIVYLVVAIVVAEIIGSSRFFTRARNYLATLLGYEDDFTHTTVWYWAIDATLKVPFRLPRVGARVTLKNDATYIGFIDMYPILGNEQRKDFVLVAAERFDSKKGAFEPVGGGQLGRVLLNSEDCYSIEVGPYGQPDHYIRGFTPERVGHFLQWVVLLVSSCIVALRLHQRDLTDSLDRLLLFVAAVAAAVALTALIRLVLVVDDRWDTAQAQGAWFLISTLYVTAALFVSLSGDRLAFWSALAATLLAIVLVIFARRAPRVSLPLPT